LTVGKPLQVLDLSNKLILGEIGTVAHLHAVIVNGLRRIMQEAGNLGTVIDA
jgi:hypothetical protein